MGCYSQEQAVRISGEGVIKDSVEITGLPIGKRKGVRETKRQIGMWMWKEVQLMVVEFVGCMGCLYSRSGWLGCQGVVALRRMGRARRRKGAGRHWVRNFSQLVAKPLRSEVPTAVFMAPICLWWLLLFGVGLNG